jgi:hypothetical protein
MMFDFEPSAKVAALLAKSAEDIRFYLDFDQANALAALQRWIKLVGDRSLAGEAISAIVAERLVRRLCPKCRVAFKPDPQRLKKLGLPADKISKLYRASGKVEVKGHPQPCPDCRGLGYRGRVGVFEVMAFDNDARGYVAAGETDPLKNHLRKQKMMYLQEAALAKVVEGVTDIKEITRVFEGGSASKDGGSGGSGEAKPSAPSRSGRSSGSEKSAKPADSAKPAKSKQTTGSGKSGQPKA